MQFNRRHVLQQLGSLAAGAALSSPALAQAYPTKPIRLVIPFPPGGGADAIIRPMNGKMSELLGQSLVIENIGGAGAIIGANTVARAAPDGYTLVAGTIASHGISPSLYPNVQYNPITDFEPIIYIGAAPYVLGIHASLGIKSMAEFIAYAKANPGKLKYASSGNGSAVHLTTERLKLAAGLDMVHVPYKGSGPSMVDLLANRVQLSYNPIGLFQSHFDSGALLPLAVSGSARLPSIPNVPTLSEIGIKNADGGGWYGLLAPAKTPADIIQKLNGAAAQTLKDPDVAKALRTAGVEPVGGTPEDFAAFIKSELAAWKEVIRVSGAKAE